MRDKWSEFIRRLRPEGWWVVAPTAAIIALMLLLTGSSAAANASQPRVLLTEVLFQEQKPLCQSCHPKQYADWQGTTHAKATLDPVFQEQLTKSHDQAACLACHTTGFDTGSGEFLAEGVTCEACHGPYKEGHPAQATMQLPMESQTCRMCHLDTFKQWETSKHAGKNIECFDCHMSHTQGLRLGSEAELCGACHNDKQTAATHATHGINGVDCATCHMSKVAETVPPTTGQQVPRDHSFKVGSDVCAGCHKDTIHTAATSSKTDVSLQLNQSAGTANSALSATGGTAIEAAQVPELQQQLSAAQKRLESLRDIAVVNMGLAFAVGGFLGLVAGIVGSALLQRRRSHEQAL